MAAISSTQATLAALPPIYGEAIAVDAAGNAYVTGDTQSPNFPTANALYPDAIGGWISGHQVGDFCGRNSWFFIKRTVIIHVSRTHKRHTFPGE